MTGLRFTTDVVHFFTRQQKDAAVFILVISFHASDMTLWSVMTMKSRPAAMASPRRWQRTASRRRSRSCGYAGCRCSDARSQPCGSSRYITANAILLDGYNQPGSTGHPWPPPMCESAVAVTPVFNRLRSQARSLPPDKNRRYVDNIRVLACAAPLPLSLLLCYILRLMMNRPNIV